MWDASAEVGTDGSKCGSFVGTNIRSCPFAASTVHCCSCAQTTLCAALVSKTPEARTKSDLSPLLISAQVSSAVAPIAFLRLRMSRDANGGGVERSSAQRAGCCCWTVSQWRNGRDEHDCRWSKNHAVLSSSGTIAAAHLLERGAGTATIVPVCLLPQEDKPWKSEAPPNDSLSHNIVATEVHKKNNT